MLYLYLDESGDLGFDFANKKPSKFFTITILTINGIDQNRKLIKAVKKTLGIKLNRKNRIYYELKGATTVLSIKKYFFNQIRNIPFGLYSISVDKRKILNSKVDQSGLYSFIAGKITQQILANESTANGIELIIDKSKNKLGIEKFNQYMMLHLKSKIDLNLPIHIEHQKSTENYGIQACDLFCSGIFQNYESKKSDWLDVFKEGKIKYNQVLN
jgi:hypothetical protein